MKQFCRRIWLVCTIVFIFTYACSMLAVDKNEYIVQNLKVEDIGHDNGANLQLSWKPLEKEKQIIEYRIYRGISADSLFLVGKIPVNKKTGVTGDVMYYYDKGFAPFVSIDSPRSLKIEKGQSESGPIYRRLPRDLKITGQYLKHFTLLGYSDKEEVYYNAERIVDGDDIYAGLKVSQIMVLARLSANKEYFYSVVAIDANRKFHPHSEIVSGVPRYNEAEKPTKLSAVYVEDGNKIQLEWVLPVEEDWVYNFDTYILPKSKIEEFKKFSEYNSQNNINLFAQMNGEEVEELKPVENPGFLIYSGNTSFPYTSLNYGVVELKDKVLTSLDGKNTIDFNKENQDDYCYAFAYKNPFGLSSFMDSVVEARTVNNSELPMIPEVTILDRLNDKGDYNELYWGRAVVLITKITYLNDKKNKIIVNYEYKENQKNKINNIYFKVYDASGNVIKERINEFYLDHKIRVNIPEGVNADDGLLFEMTVKINDKIEENYVLSQKAVFSGQTLSLIPSDLYVNKDKAFEYGLNLYKKNLYEDTVRLAKKNSGITREVFDSIPFEKKVYPSIIGPMYDSKRKLILTRPSIKVGYDLNEKVSIEASLFAGDQDYIFNSGLRNLEKKLSEAKEEEKESIEQMISLEKEEVAKKKEIYNNYKNFAEVNKLKNSKSRMKMLVKDREKIKRSFCYRLVRTDGEGKFSVGDICKNEEGKEYFLPKGNWFNSERIPSLIATLLFTIIVFICINKAKRGKDFYIRPIAGIQEIDNAIGRATEMGRPILFQPGLSGISDVATLAGLSILGRVAKKAAEYDTKILVPVRDYIVLPIAQEIVKEAHYEAGRPDTFDKNSVFFITTAQFAFVAGVNGVMVREKTATNFYMGMFYAESLIMTETGNATGAIQIAGTDAATQIPFFITTCDYTLIGEELYAASAYMTRGPLMMGTLKAQDITKLIIMISIVVGTLLSTMHITSFINWFPEK